MEHESRWVRLAPLAGITFVVLLLVLFFVLSKNTPDSHDSTQKIFSFYTGHRAREEAAGIVFAFAGLFLALFAATLARRVRLAERLPGGLSWVVLAMGILAAMGLLLTSATHYATAESANHHLPLMTRTLSNLDNDAFPAFFLPGIAFYLFAGIAIVRSHALPRWLGIFGIVIAVLSINPVGFFAWFFGGMIFTVAASILMMRRPAVDATAGGAVARTPA